jgi:hypothetical protein
VVSVSEHSAPRFVNCTIADNIGGGIYAAVRSVPVVINSILWHNGAGAIEFDANSNSLVSYSDIEGGFQGTQNLDPPVDPMFIDAANGNYQLTANSPLIDRGNPERSYRDHFVPPSLGTNRCDIGAFGGPLGGSWTLSEVAITVFQNPAFPHWIDIFVTALDGFETTPGCSLEYRENAKVAVTLHPNLVDAYTYMGSWEASSSGNLFISVDAELSDGQQQRVSRMYSLNFIGVEGGVIQTVGVEGFIVLPPGWSRREAVIMTGTDSQPVNPPAAGGKVFLSPLFFVTGLDVPLHDSVELNVNFFTEGWREEDRRRLGIYRLEGGEWQLLAGGVEQNRIYGFMDRGGCFAVALSDNIVPVRNRMVPANLSLVNAYPNPFNRDVSLRFDLEREAYVVLSIYDLGGRRVAQLIDGELTAGMHLAVWDGRSDNGALLPSGIYCARFACSDSAQLVKLLLLR